MDKQIVFSHLRDINSHIAFPEEAALRVMSLVDVIASDEDFEAMLKKIEANSVRRRNIDQTAIDALAEAKGVDRDLLRLTAIELFTMGMKERYIEEGWSMDIYYDSLLDLTIWAKVCFDRTGHWGLVDTGFLFSTIIGRVVRLGRLQFELMKVPEENYGRVIGGVMLEKDMLIINIHIPEGCSITPDKRLDSYRRAYKFFGKSGIAVFHCHSWLLYEKHYELLPQSSNIISFMNDFELIHDATKDGNGDMWRLFGTPWFTYSDDYDALPQNTNLQRIYVSHLKNGGTGGSSKGFFAFDGENIIK